MALLLANAVHAAIPFTLEVRSVNVNPALTSALSGVLSEAQIEAAIQTGLNAVIDPIEADMQASLNESAPDLSQKDRLTAFANAGVMGNNGVDYMTNMKFFLLSGNLGLACAAGHGTDCQPLLSTLGDAPNKPLSFKSISDSILKGSIPGIAVPVNFMIGVSLAPYPLPALGPVDLKRMDIYMNVFSFDFSDIATAARINGNVTNFGLHGKYKLFRGRNADPFGLIRWNGLDLISGFDIAHYKMLFNTTLELPPSSGSVNTGMSSVSTGIIESGSENYTLNGTTDIEAGFSMTNFTIPVEATTSVRLLYLLSAFVGLGADINLGGMSTIANADTNATATVTGKVDSGGGHAPMDYGTIVIGSNVDLGETAHPYLMDLRLMGGMQMNLGPVHLYTKAATNLFYSGYSVHVGITAGW